MTAACKFAVAECLEHVGGGENGSSAIGRLRSARTEEPEATPWDRPITVGRIIGVS